MTSLVVEDGSIVMGANTYVDASVFNTHLSNRGLSFNSTAGTVEQTLILAMDYIETRKYFGLRVSSDQSLSWPRADVWIDNYPIPNNVIPDVLKKAQIEVAIAIDSGNNPNSNLDRTTKREKVGDVEVEYSDSARDSVKLTAVDDLLKQIASLSSSRVASVGVIRA